jgi:hypothetical protein
MPNTTPFPHQQRCELRDREHEHEVGEQLDGADPDSFAAVGLFSCVHAQV